MAKGLALFVSIACLAFVRAALIDLHAQPAPDAATKAPVQVVTSMYTGTDGLTHFKQIEVPTERLIRLKGGVMFSRAQARSDAPSAFHPGPFRRYVITLSGVAEIVGSSGEKFIADRDHILLVDDLTGKGHTTRIVGPDDWVTLMVELDEVRPRERLLRVCQPPLCTP